MSIKEEQKSEKYKQAEKELEQFLPVFTFALFIFAFDHMFFEILKLNDAPYGGLFFFAEVMIFIGFCYLVLHKHKVQKKD